MKHFSMCCNTQLLTTIIIITVITQMNIKNLNSIEPRHENTCFMPYANNEGADQPTHPRSLISAFVVRCLDSITPLVVTFEISRL